MNICSTLKEANDFTRLYQDISIILDFDKSAFPTFGIATFESEWSLDIAKKDRLLQEMQHQLLGKKFMLIASAIGHTRSQEHSRSTFVR